MEPVTDIPHIRVVTTRDHAILSRLVILAHTLHHIPLDHRTIFVMVATEIRAIRVATINYTVTLSQVVVLDTMYSKIRHHLRIANVVLVME